MNSFDMSLLSPPSLGRLKKINNIGLFCSLVILFLRNYSSFSLGISHISTENSLRTFLFQQWTDSEVWN